MSVFEKKHYYCRTNLNVMRTFFRYGIALIVSLLCLSVNAQVDAEGTIYDEDPPMIFVEEMPEFPGGIDSLKAYLAKEIQYPPVAKNNGITGTVLIEFVVEKDGRVTNGKVKVPLFPDCDVEAMRVVMSMPNWKPGKNMGQPVRCFYQVPVTFRL